MGANISHHKRLQEKVTSKKSDVSVKQKSMAFEQNSISSNESVDDQNFKPTIKIAENKSPTQRNLIEEIGRPEKEEDQDSLEENKDIKKTNSNPTSLVITICMLKMENSEKMIVEQSAPSSSAVHLLSNTNEHNVPVPVAAAPKCRCYEIEGGSTNNSALNNLNKSRGSHLNIICDNKNNNGNSLMNNEENVNILNNNTESNHILNKFNLNNKFDNLTINDVNDNNSDEMYNQINDCSVLQLSGGSIISMDMDGLQGQFKFPGFNDEKILNTSISGPSNDSHISSSSCCRKKTSSSSSKNSIRKGCKCGNNPNSSKENAAHSPPSSSKSKKGNWGGLKFNCAKLKNNNVKTNSSFSSSSSDFPMETAKGKSEPESCVCTSYRKVEDCHSTPLPVSHPELTLLELDAQGNVIQRIETSRNTQSGSIVFFLNHGEPIMNISRSFNDEFPIDDIDERTRRLDNQLITTHPQPLFICTHSPCPSSPEPISLLHRRLLDNQNELNQNANDIRIHSQVDFVHFLVPDLQKILACSYYWAKIDRYEAEKLLEGKPEGTFLLRDSAQEEFLFSVSFRKYNRSLHARIEQFNHKFSFDSRDPGVYTASTVTGLLEHYKDPAFVMFFEPMLTQPLNRNFSFSLQQLCRATIATHTTYDGVDKLCLPNSLKNYLKEYHYRHRVRSRENFYSNI